MELIEYQVDNIVQEERAFVCESDALTTGDCGNDMLFGGRETTSGMPFGPQSVFSYAPAWQALSMISGDVSKLKVYLCKREETEYGMVKERLWDHPLTRLVQEQPNEEMNAVEFWRFTMQQLLLWGNAYILISRNSAGVPESMVHMLADRTQTYRTPEGDYSLWYLGGGDGPLDYDNPSLMGPMGEGSYLWHTWAPEEDVIHLKWMMDYGVPSMSQYLWRAAKDSMGLGLAQESYAAGFFKMGGRIGGVLTTPDTWTKDSHDNFVRGFREAYEDVSKAFRVIPLRDNAKFVHGQYNFEQTQMSQIREVSARDAARWFNMPAAKLNVEGAISYNSLSEANRDYLNQTLSPWLAMICAELKRHLLLRNQKRSHYFEHDTDELKIGDPTARADMATKVFSSNLASLNEVRTRYLDLPPIPGGDEVMPPEPEPAEEPQGEEQQPGQEPDEPDEDRGRVLYPMTYSASKANEKSLGALKDWVAHGHKEFRALSVRYTGKEDLVDEFRASLVAVLSDGQGDVQGRIDLVIEAYHEQANGRLSEPYRVA